MTFKHTEETVIRFLSDDAPCGAKHCREHTGVNPPATHIVDAQKFSDTFKVRVKCTGPVCPVCRAINNAEW